MPTSNSKIWILKIFILLAPFLGYFLVPGLVLFSAGEFWTLSSLERAAKHSLKTKEPFLFGATTTMLSMFYKVFTLRNSEPKDLIVIGSSKGRSWSHEMFPDNINFYNASSEKFSLDRYLPFLEAVAEKQKLPKRIFFALDPVDYGNGLCQFYKTTNVKSLFDTFPDIDPLSIIQDQIKKIWIEVRTGTIKIPKLIPAFFEPYPRGLFTFREPIAGYRKDGSYKPATLKGRSILAIRIHIHQEEQNILKHGVSYPQGPDFDPSCLDPLRKLLVFAKTNNIEVAAMMTPHPPTIRKALMKDIQGTGYARGMTEPMKKLFEEFGFHYYDGRVAEEYGARDEESYDFVHMSPVAYAKAFKFMSARWPELQGTFFRAPQDYDTLVKNAPNHLELFQKYQNE